MKKTGNAPPFIGYGVFLIYRMFFIIVKSKVILYNEVKIRTVSIGVRTLGYLLFLS